MTSIPPEPNQAEAGAASQSENEVPAAVPKLITLEGSAKQLYETLYWVDSALECTNLDINRSRNQLGSMQAVCVNVYNEVMEWKSRYKSLQKHYASYAQQQKEMYDDLKAKLAAAELTVATLRSKLSGKTEGWDEGQVFEQISNGEREAVLDLFTGDEVSVKRARANDDSNSLEGAKRSKRRK